MNTKYVDSFLFKMCIVSAGSQNEMCMNTSFSCLLLHYPFYHSAHERHSGYAVKQVKHMVSVYHVYAAIDWFRS